MKVPKCIQQHVAFRAIQAYAVHSYIYYGHNTNIISDHEYDELCKWLAVNFDWVKPHDLNEFLELDMLACGSGYHIPEQICGQTKIYADELLAAHLAKAPLPEPPDYNKAKTGSLF